MVTSAIHRRPAVVSVVLTAVFLLAASIGARPVGAIVGGQEDTANTYANVGQLQIQFDGDWFGFCSGTLIAESVVLTAAHCTDFIALGFVPLSDVRVNFNPAPGDPSAADDPAAYGVANVVVHPDFFDAVIGPGVNAKNVLASPWEDIALIWLTHPVAGVTPAPFAGPGYLDALDLKAESFTAVGYGLNGLLKGSLVSPNGTAINLASRSFRDVSVLGHDAYPDRFVKISAAVCPGDSGGALFHGDTLVGINVWSNSLRCSGPGLEYRLDSTIAQAFLPDNP